MNKTVLRVSARVERVCIRQRETGVSCDVTLQFQPAANSGGTGYVTIEVEEPTAVELRSRVGKTILFVLEDA